MRLVFHWGIIGLVAFAALTERGQEFSSCDVACHVTLAFVVSGTIVST